MKNPVRVIPRLDIKGPNVVKGIQLEGNRILGLAHELATKYYLAGADELFYQDVVASLYRRNSLLDLVKRTAETLFIPLTVAGGIRSVEDIRQLLRAGADKVAINTAAVENPNLLHEAAKEFGSQCVVASIEVFRVNGKFQVWTDFGREVSSREAVSWAVEAAERGAGEIMLTSINNDGMGRGYDLELTHEISSRVAIPVIAAGGAGRVEHLAQAVIEGGADAVAAASLFHYRYAEAVNTPTMTYADRSLRMGQQIDSGNIEFLREGYGGTRTILVTPSEIREAKEHMQSRGIVTRRPAGEVPAPQNCPFIGGAV